MPAYLRGFTIRNCKESDGGGALLLQNSYALLVQRVFHDNTGDFGGAAIIRGVGSAQFVNCTFCNNGLSAPSASNTYGGGTVLIRDTTPLFAKCLLENNEAEEGGATLVGEGTPTFVNSQALFQRIEFLTPPAGPQPPVPDQICNNPRHHHRHCDIQGGWTSGSGILDVDPIFQGSFYLVADYSPAKNARRRRAARRRRGPRLGQQRTRIL